MKEKKDYLFQSVPLKSLQSFRALQVKDLKAQTFDSLDERIELSNPDCVKITYGEEEIGYACLDSGEAGKHSVLEFFIIRRCRQAAKIIFQKLAADYQCKEWFVNSNDSFAMPLMLDLGLSYELDGYIFSADRETAPRMELPDGITLVETEPCELDAVYRLVMQDGFYTGDGAVSLARRIAHEEIYLLKSGESLVGVGFVSPIGRTPDYADIAMILDGNSRGHGLGTALVSGLIQICLSKNLLPTALTSVSNHISRKTLQKCGFYLDGCLLSAKIK